MTLKKTNYLLAALAVSLLTVGVLANHGRITRKISYWCTGAVRIDGMWIYPNPQDRVITTALVDYGVWEPMETSVIRDQLHEGDTFVDVGANIGYYTLIASKKVGPRGRVIAFEPAPENFALLKRSVNANGCSNVTLEQKALSDKPGTLKLYIEETNKGGHKIFQFGTPLPYVEVAAMRLDDYLQQDRGRLDLIKIDTEGAEGAILAGMQETLRERQNVRLLVEFFPMLLHSFGSDPAAVLTNLQSLGFELGDVSESSERVTPVTSQQLLARHKIGKASYTNLLLRRPSPSAVAAKPSPEGVRSTLVAQESGQSPRRLPVSPKSALPPERGG